MIGITGTKGKSTTTYYLKYIIDEFDFKKVIVFITALFNKAMKVKEYNLNDKVFLKTKKKDFNGLIDLTELFDKESDLRKAFSYHQDEEFIISEKVDVNQDEIGKEEYRVFIYKNIRFI